MNFIYLFYKFLTLATNGSLSCVPRVGLFLFFEEPFNFPAAQLVCGKLNATLAHVISEERTEGLMRIIGNVPTFVGLSSQGEKRSWKNEFGMINKNQINTNY